MPVTTAQTVVATWGRGGKGEGGKGEGEGGKG